MNHKRGRPKNRRAGCKLCKPWKGVGKTKLKSSKNRMDEEKVKYDLEEFIRE